MSAKKIQRQERIVELIREHQCVSVGMLVETLGVSAQTVRRDINRLCDDNLLRRRHGGAELFERQLNTPYDQRTTTNATAKRAIARLVAEMIPEGSTLFISIGSTPMMVAEALTHKKGLTVVTNNLNAALALSGETTNRIILPGGEMRLPDRDILGDEVVALYEGYRADFGIFGVAGVAEDGGLLDFHASEVRVRERIRMSCRTSVLVADSTKFGRTAPAVGGSIFEVDRIVLDRFPGDGFGGILERVADRLRVAGGKSAP